MDNNLNNTPSTAIEPTVVPQKKTSGLWNIGLSLLKAIGYVGVWLGIQTIIVSFLSVIFVIATPGLTQKELNELINSYSMELTLITNLISLGAFVIIFVILKKSFLKRINATAPPALSLVPTAILGISVQFSTLLILGVLMAVFPKEWVESMEQNSELITGSNQIVVFIVAVIVAPIFEEIMCRGLILGTLRKSTNKWIAIILSSLIFGVIHGNAIQIIYATTLGIMLGWLYTKTNSIFVPMLCHLAFNLTSMLLQYVNTENLIIAAILSVIMLASLPVTIGCIVFLNICKMASPKEQIPQPQLQYDTYTPAPEYNAEALARLENEIEGKNNENGD